MADPSVLETVNRAVGVVIALVGSFVIAPRGTSMLWGTIAETSGRARRGMSAFLARFPPFLRQDVKVVTESAGAGVGVGGAVTVTAAGRAWPAGASVDERIEALRRYVTEVEGRLNDVTTQLSTEVARRQGAVRSLESALRGELATLRSQLEEQERQSAQIDARGLPVIGWGILLSGIPDWLARFPVALAWVFPMAGLILTAAALRDAVLEHRRRRGPSSV